MELKENDTFKVIGTPRKRIDARDIVTGKKQFAMDLQVPGALPTMVCRAPTLNGSPRAIRNKADRPGDARRHRRRDDRHRHGRPRQDLRPVHRRRCARSQVDWGNGSAEGESDETVLKKLRAGQIPLAIPKVPVLAKTIEADFTFMFRSSAALEPYAAIADVRADKARSLGRPEGPRSWPRGRRPGRRPAASAKVKVNVITGGGSFGHKLFANHAVEAAQVSKAMGKPVRLMWHRADEPRQGRAHPMAPRASGRRTSPGRCSASSSGTPASPPTSATGCGDMLSATGGRAARRSWPTSSFSESIFR